MHYAKAGEKRQKESVCSKKYKFVLFAFSIMMKPSKVYNAFT